MKPSHQMEDLQLSLNDIAILSTINYITEEHIAQSSLERRLSVLLKTLKSSAIDSRARHTTLKSKEVLYATFAMDMAKQVR